MIPDIIDDTSTTMAVVGASDSPGKYGGRIYRDLKAKGYTVFAVNPRADTVDGDPAYASVADLPSPADIIDLVVPASAGTAVVGGLGDPPPFVWVQPGAESRELTELLADRDIAHVADGSCIMVETRQMGR